MLFNKKISGYEHIENPLKIILKNSIYPNFYISIFRFIIRKIKQIFE